MYYTRITKIWVIDTVDIFLFSFIAGSYLAQYIKHYTSETVARRRLAKCIIEKSKLSKTPSQLREQKINRVYQFAISNRGGQFDFDPDYIYTETSELWVDEHVYKLATEIKKVVERLYAYFVKHELYGRGQFF